MHGNLLKWVQKYVDFNVLLQKETPVSPQQYILCDYSFVTMFIDYVSLELRNEKN